MRFLVREVFGWILLVLGLYLFYEVYAMVQETIYFGCIPVLLIGIFVFRGGVHLIKVALAARVCSEARADDAEAQRRTSAPVHRPLPGRTAPLGQT
jgi:hypothetical protein